MSAIVDKSKHVVKLFQLFYVGLTVNLKFQMFCDSFVRTFPFLESLVTIFLPAAKKIHMEIIFNF